MCQHKDDAVLWALDFILLKGEAPQTLFNTTDKYILIETKWENFTWCVFIFFFFIFVHLREQGFHFSLLISLSKHRFEYVNYG